MNENEEQHVENCTEGVNCLLWPQYYREQDRVFQLAFQEEYEEVMRND